MKTPVKNIYKTMTMALFLLLVCGGYALASTVEGTVQGLTCIIHGKLCPVDGKDPHAAAENVFVIHSGKRDYKIVSNLDRSILTRYLGQKVRVNGDVNTDYNAIEAESFQVFKNGKFRTVWTLKQEMEERNRFLRGGGGGR